MLILVIAVEREDLGWKILSRSNIWAYGPDETQSFFIQFFQNFYGLPYFPIDIGCFELWDDTDAASRIMEVDKAFWSDKLAIDPDYFTFETFLKW